jgi:hypothetical protein
VRLVQSYKKRWSTAIPPVWIFNLTGTLDLANAFRQKGTIAYMGATWFIPTFLVPILLITRIMIFSRLIKDARSR